MLAMLPLAHARASSAVWGGGAGHWALGPGKLSIDTPYKDEHPLWGPETPADEAMAALDGWLHSEGELRVVATLPVAALPPAPQVQLDVDRLQELLDFDTFVSGALHDEEHVSRLMSPLDTLRKRLWGERANAPAIGLAARADEGDVRVISQTPLDAIMRMAAAVMVADDGQPEHTAAMWLQSSGGFMGLRYEVIGRQSILLDVRAWNHVVNPDLEGTGSAGYRFDIRGAVEALSAHCPVARELAKELKI